MSDTRRCQARTVSILQLFAAAADTCGRGSTTLSVRRRSFGVAMLAPSASGLRKGNGASRTRTGDLLGAIQNPRFPASPSNSTD